MKKYFLLPLFVLCFAHVINAQFVLTSQGFTNDNDPQKDFLVYDFEGKSQNELYTKVLSFVTSTYRSPQDVISKVENEMVTINGIQPKKIGNGFFTWDLNYTVTIRIKDDKIRIDAPSFKCEFIDDRGRTNYLTLSESNAGLGADVKTRIFKKDGSVAKDFAKEQLEIFFNSLISELTKFINNKENDEW
ncbi:MAG: DUF4468 domain-containing protein [Mangrovibacterium sp.]|nr:DUF4468 domain-containing protein [Mangrovibacterium sp.]